MIKRLAILTLTIIALPSMGFSEERAKVKETKSVDEDVRELEELIESGRKPTAREPATGEPVAKKEISEKKEESESFYKDFGNNMSLRGDGKYFYINAGPTSIVVDREGRVQINSAENVHVESKKSIFLKADENISLVAGGEIIESKGQSKENGAKEVAGPKPSSEAIGYSETEESAAEKPTAEKPMAEKPKEETTSKEVTEESSTEKSSTEESLDEETVATPAVSEEEKPETPAKVGSPKSLKAPAGVKKDEPLPAPTEDKGDLSDDDDESSGSDQTEEE